MIRRSFLTGAAALATLPALPAQAQALSLGAISQYLNSLQTVQGAFTQVNGDGTISTGTIYIKRPGRVRFEYNPPERSMVIAGGGQLAIFDPRAGDVDRYPLNQTPLSIILARNVDLTRARMVTSHTSDGTLTTVRAQDPDNPQYGNIDLVFTANPIELRQWRVNDDTGGTTTIILGDTTQGVRIGDRLFNIQAEMRNWNG
ncbi:MAG: LolA family protein [Shimia sp.]